MYSNYIINENSNSIFTKKINQKRQKKAIEYVVKIKKNVKTKSLLYA